MSKATNAYMPLCAFSPWPYGRQVLPSCYKYRPSSSPLSSVVCTSKSTVTSQALSLSLARNQVERYNMEKFSLSFHFNSFSYLCVALYIHFPQSPFALIALVPVSMASDPYNTVETKAIHHTDTQDPIRTRSNTITTTNQRDTTARNLATVINLMAMIIRNQLSYEYSPPSYGYDKKPSGYEYQPSPYGYDKYDKKLSYDYSPPSLTMHRRRLFRVYGFAFQ